LQENGVNGRAQLTISAIRIARSPEVIVANLPVSTPPLFEHNLPIGAAFEQMTFRGGIH
jgi:hypothetical protein